MQDLHKLAVDGVDVAVSTAMASSGVVPPPRHARRGRDSGQKPLCKCQHGGACFDCIICVACFYCSICPPCRLHHRNHAATFHCLGVIQHGTLYRSMQGSEEQRRLGPRPTTSPLGTWVVGLLSRGPRGGALWAEEEHDDGQCDREATS